MNPEPPPINRRAFTSILGKIIIATGSFLNFGRVSARTSKAPSSDGGDDGYDYIIVGSGAGGGPLACNLARAGCRVLVLEAGGYDENDNYRVPVFHAMSTEDPAFSWKFFVRHYTDEKQQMRDPKYQRDQHHGGVFYPRAGTLGGCTAHHAMITVYPHPDDWDHIAELTGDPSWCSKRMRRYYKRLERCQYVKPYKAPFSGHGFRGWLPTTQASAFLGIGDGQIKRLVESAFKVVHGKFVGLLRSARFLFGLLDPNSDDSKGEGVYSIPISVCNKHGRRQGTREYLLHTRDKFPEFLKIQTHALVTRVLFAKDDATRAVGVEYMEGAHLYHADPRSKGIPDGPRRQVFARREVILCGGAFNTPQLLMLSGIGSAEELRGNDIPVRVNSPGVGKSLQDRCEVGVISEMKSEFTLLKGADFKAGDAKHQEWEKYGKGTYATNGGLLAVLRKSSEKLKKSDQFIFALAGHFEGYFVGWSKLIPKFKNRLTWCVLHADPENSGSIKLQSRDPRAVPEINFNYFPQGTKEDEILGAVANGIEFAREINNEARDVIGREILPGEDVSGLALRQFVKDNAWGHHACGTCRIGGDKDRMAVLDSEFCVRGTSNLRVVDASVFPKIPGYFIVLPIYMISEKASDVILASARRQTHLGK